MGKIDLMQLMKFPAVNRNREIEEGMETQHKKANITYLCDVTFVLVMEHTALSVQMKTLFEVILKSHSEMFV